jgi:hypothetical protein
VQISLTGLQLGEPAFPAAYTGEGLAESLGFLDGKKALIPSKLKNFGFDRGIGV